MEIGPHSARCLAIFPNAKWCQAVVIVAALWLSVMAPAGAVERSALFLRGLQGRGYTDMVLEYLAQMEASPLASEEFRRLIPYHRAVAHIEASRRATNSQERTQLLDAARVELEEFAASNPDRVEGAEARSRLGSVLVEQAKQLLLLAGRYAGNSAYADQRESHLNDARRLFDEARRMFSAAEQFYQTALDAFPKTLDPKKEQDRIAQRREYRGRLAQTRVLVAQTDYEKAQSYAEGSRKFQALNEAAAEQFAELFEKYSDWLVGSYALFYEGRCYQALKDFRRAQGSYDTINSMADAVGNNAPYRELITRCQRYKLECQLELNQLDEAIAGAQAWLRRSHPSEEQHPDWLALRFRMAEAYQQKAAALSADSPQRRRLLKEASQSFRVVAQIPGEFQQQARSAVAELGVTRRRLKVPSTFTEANEAARTALDVMQQSQLQKEIAPADAPDEIAALEEQITQSKMDAIELFQLALRRADDAADLSLLNEARYFLSWLYFQEQDYFRAAVLGEFVARRYSDHRFAAAAAKIAMASYERLFNQTIAALPGDDETEFETSHLAEMAKFITRRWPDTGDAAAAYAVLLNLALRHDRLEEAERLLQEVPPDRRGAMQLRLGSALWLQYLELSTEEDTSASSAAKLEALRAEAVDLLESGLTGRSASSSVTAADAAAALYLVQARLSNQDYQRAVELLDDERIGPLTLVKQDHPAVADREFASLVFRTALQAFVSVNPPQGERAVEMMTAMEQVQADDAEAEKQLTRVYVGLGMQLQRQVEELAAAGRREEAERVGKAFAEFLKRVAARQAGASWAVRSWIAHTYLGMGDGLGAGSGDAQNYYEQARDTLQEMIELAERNPGFAPDPLAVLSAQNLLGEALRKTGKYQEALDTFSFILKEKEARIGVQKAAAYTYQERGVAEDSKWLLRAITGGYKLRSTGKNRIWGWARIAQVVRRYIATNPQHRDTFFEAWLNIARCRYLMGLQASGAERSEQFQRAKRTISALMQQYPDLGGEGRRAEFNQLARQIQRAEGSEPRGLAEFAAVARQP